MVMRNVVSVIGRKYPRSIFWQRLTVKTIVVCLILYWGREVFVYNDNLWQLKCTKGLPSKRDGRGRDTKSHTLSFWKWAIAHKAKSCAKYLYKMVSNFSVFETLRQAYWKIRSVTLCKEQVLQMSICSKFSMRPLKYHTLNSDGSGISQTGDANLKVIWLRWFVKSHEGTLCQVRFNQYEVTFWRICVWEFLHLEFWLQWCIW